MISHAIIILSFKFLGCCVLCECTNLYSQGKFSQHHYKKITDAGESQNTYPEQQICDYVLMVMDYSNMKKNI
jgi:hypothetical protein